MAINITDINGNTYIGVFCRPVGRITLCPMDTPEEFIDLVEKVLDLKVVRTASGNTNLHGSLIAANSKGLISPYFYAKEDIEKDLKDAQIDGKDQNIAVEISQDPHSAWGNNVLLSEKIALVNPDMQTRSLKLIEETFQVEAVKGTIAGIKTIGSIAVLNNRGMVVHPKATEDDLEMLKILFKVEANICTANFGSPYLGASMIANDKGALVGSRSSGVELNRIENSLDIID
jgi:translation initiation factor 6